ncbi:MAG: hypothetical protein WA610_05365, partial [Thermodesulfovibrionales bacterium]
MSSKNRNTTHNSDWKASGVMLGLVLAFVVAAVGFSFSTAAAAVDVIINGLPYKLDQGGLRYGTDGSITINMSNQTYTGKISGKVDVLGTEVFLKSPAIDTGVAKYTRVDRFGNFQFDNLPDGTFDVMPVLDGYTFTHPPVQSDLHAITGGVPVQGLIFNGASTSGTPSPSPSSPSAPASLTCTVASSTQINLSWSDTTNETGYRIYRNTQNLMAGTPISLSAGS